MTFENRQYSINDLAPLISECVKSGQKVKMLVTGTSMFPLLHDRKDTVELTAVNGKLRKYDIVLHRRTNGKYIMHRIIKAKGDVLTIAGDFETEKEYPVYTDQVMAKVCGFWRNGRYFSCDGLFFKVYSFLWVAIFPFRHLVLGILIALRRKLRVKK